MLWDELLFKQELGNYLTPVEEKIEGMAWNWRFPFTILLGTKISSNRITLAPNVSTEGEKTRNGLSGARAARAPLLVSAANTIMRLVVVLFAWQKDYTDPTTSLTDLALTRVARSAPQRRQKPQGWRVMTLNRYRYPGPNLPLSEYAIKQHKEKRRRDKKERKKIVLTRRQSGQRTGFT